jgi:hypothetical protein
MINWRANRVKEFSPWTRGGYSLQKKKIKKKIKKKKKIKN